MLVPSGRPAPRIALRACLSRPSPLGHQRPDVPCAVISCTATASPLPAFLSRRPLLASVVLRAGGALTLPARRSPAPAGRPPSTVPEGPRASPARSGRPIHAGVPRGAGVPPLVGVHCCGAPAQPRRECPSRRRPPSGCRPSWSGRRPPRLPPRPAGFLDQSLILTRI